MSLECANQPLIAGRPEEAHAFQEARALLLHELSRKRKLLVEPTRPLVAYMLLFGERPHVNIQRRVRDAYAHVNRQRSRRAEYGYIYVFRDSRDGDVATVKIGSTVNVHRRIAEWRTALGAADDELVLLFSAKSSDIRLAENIMHALLFCQWLPKRVRADTGASLLEYFRVPNLHALRALLAATARHASWFTEERRMRARSFE